MISGELSLVPGSGSIIISVTLRLLLLVPRFSAVMYWSCLGHRRLVIIPGWTCRQFCAHLQSSPPGTAPYPAAAYPWTSCLWPVASSAADSTTSAVRSKRCRIEMRASCRQSNDDLTRDLPRAYTSSDAAEQSIIIGCLSGSLSTSRLQRWRWKLAWAKHRLTCRQHFIHINRQELIQ